MSTGTLTRAQDTSTAPQDARTPTLPLCSRVNNTQTLPRATDDVCPMTQTDGCPSSQAEIDRCGSC